VDITSAPDLSAPYLLLFLDPFLDPTIAYKTACYRE